jgi:hypothetical protein
MKTRQSNATHCAQQQAWLLQIERPPVNKFPCNLHSHPGIGAASSDETGSDSMKYRASRVGLHSRDNH